MKLSTAVATISMARNDAEAEELSSAMRALRSCGMPVVVADRSSHVAFRKFLGDEGFEVVEGARGLVEQARLAVTTAAGRGSLVLYTEPDKRFFFSDRLATFLEAAGADGDSEVLLPGRSAESYATFSESQQKIERAVNEFCSRLFGMEGDF